MKKIFYVLFFFLIGCATIPKPTMEQIEAADCGAFPLNYEDAIKGVISPHLLDPYSAMFTFTRPLKGWNDMGSKPIYGWVVCGTVNAKNRFGGYVGVKPFYTMIRNDTVIRLVTPGGIVIPDSFFWGFMSENEGLYTGLCPMQ